MSDLVQTANGIRVLVVEDNPMVGEMIQGILNRLGYRVVGLAMNGKQALVKMAALAETRDRPDVVLMDIEMPGMNGIEASRQIQERFPTPVVILTAYDQPGLITQAGQAGAGAYLIKPPNLGELERAIAIAIARFADMQALRQLNARLEDEIAERARAQVALNATNEELRARHHRQTVLARAASRFNAATSVGDVLDTLLQSISELGYAGYTLWERREERLYWLADRPGAPLWWREAIDRIIRGKGELAVSAALSGPSIYARCFGQQSSLSAARGSELVDGLDVGGLPLSFLPAAVGQAVRALADQQPALRYSVFSVGEYGVLALVATQDDRPRHPWVRLVTAQAATAIGRQQLIVRLQQALAEVHTLSGLLPICAHCKKIRDDQGYWHQVEEYIQERSHAEFSHGLCPDCAQQYYAEYFDDPPEPQS